MLVNSIDKLIGYFSPRSGIQRAQYRHLLKRKYDGAARTKRTSKWLTTSQSVNAENRGAQTVLRDRARDLIRNEPFATRGQQVISSNVVGKGVMPQLPEGDVSDMWKFWADSTRCDFNGKSSYTGMQNLIMNSVSSDGEIFAKKIIDPKAKIPLKIQLLESDFCPMDERVFGKNNNKVIQGIELDEIGRTIAYHMYKVHPNSSGLEQVKGVGELIRVPRTDIAHILRTDRAGQLRGVSWFAPVMILLNDLSEYQGAELLKQKVSSLFAGFIKDIDGDLDESDKDDFVIEPATLQKLPGGMDITFSNPPSTEFYPQYVSNIMHSIAAGLGITYESMTGDLKEVNFSSARMGWLEMNRNFDVWRKNIINTQFNGVVFPWFIEALILKGFNVPDPDFVPSWTSPKRQMIDPTKEIPAKIDAIRAGLSTFSGAIREEGEHPDDHFKELANDKKLLKKYGLVLDSDASQKAKNGQNLVEVNVDDKKKDGT